jgi:outer membrane protein OmpA-like peptidoglycan-associated protein
MKQTSSFVALLCLCLLPALVTVALAPPKARAQTAGFSINRFDVSERGSDWFVGDSLDLRGNARPSIGFVLDYANKPLVLYSEEGVERAVIVKDQFYGHFGASLVIAERLRLALNVPVAFVSNGQSAAWLDRTIAAESGTALGDIRVGADLRLVGRYGGPATLALGAQVYVPTGQQTFFTGDGKVRLTPHLSLAGRISIFQYAVRAALNYRAQDVVLTNVPTGTEVQFAAAAGLSLVNHSVLLGPELWGSTVVVNDGAFQKETTPFELLFGVHYRPRNFRFGVGVGPGLTRGIGTPALRVVGMFEWSPSVDEDRDHDKIFDHVDACPDVPGVPHADPKKHGCPPSDRDGDGFPDDVDACPDVPGVASNDPAKNGCPIPGDRDNDGIIDEEDDCPDEPGVPSDIEGRNGCPIKDSDGDGILDPQDACPTVPGPANPDPEKNGCPPARIERDQIVITERVEFKTDSAELLGSSTGILTAVMNILKEHTELKRVLVEGHTDNVGGARYNKGLSERRAKSVVKWLIEHGVEPHRLLDAGIGLERPIDTNDTSAGRQKNRRVEFHILEGQGKRE